MQLRRDFLIGVGILLLLNLLLALGAAGLLMRMSPAIRDIIRENVVSLEATEVMLSVLASGGESGQESSQGQERFQESLERAKSNVTEDAEMPVLERIEALSSAALQGEVRALREVEALILELAEINRRAMTEADAEARRLGTAGAWIAVFFALASLIIGLLVIHRLDSRLVKPLMELNSVLAAWTSGESRRRFTLSTVPTESRGMFERLNELLDHDSSLKENETERDTRVDFDLQRAALIFFLERFGQAAVILDGRGRVAAANQEALRMLVGPEGEVFRSELEKVLNGPEEAENLETTAFNDMGWLCLRKPGLR